MRKAWRSHLPLDETLTGRKRGGDHCQMMGDWLEMSGWVRSIPTEKERQTAFWQALRDKTKKNPDDSDTLELDDGERLCAIALVKRLFPILKEADLTAAIGWVPGDDRDRIRQWPSTRAMAAIPWLMEAEHHPEAAAEFDFVVGTQAPLYRNWVEERNADHHLGRRFGVLGQLDGSLFYKTALQNARDFKINDPNAQDIRDKLIKARGALIKAVGIGEPSPYYAILLMDGDSVGALIRELGAGVVTRLFSAFTDTVPGIVKGHHGACIYAGGDDVLAMLPLTTALDCARALRAAYQNAATRVANEATKSDLGRRGTISAAIVFAEATVPLRLVLQHAREGLEHRAKAVNGRDSVAPPKPDKAKAKGKARGAAASVPARMIAVAQTPVIIDPPALIQPGADLGPKLIIRAVGGGQPRLRRARLDTGVWKSLNALPYMWKEASHRRPQGVHAMIVPHFPMTCGKTRKTLSLQNPLQRVGFGVTWPDGRD